MKWFDPDPGREPGGLPIAERHRHGGNKQAFLQGFPPHRPHGRSGSGTRTTMPWGVLLFPSPARYHGSSGGRESPRNARSPRSMLPQYVCNYLPLVVEPHLVMCPRHLAEEGARVELHWMHSGERHTFCRGQLQHPQLASLRETWRPWSLLRPGDGHFPGILTTRGVAYRPLSGRNLRWMKWFTRIPVAPAAPAGPPGSSTRVPVCL